MKIILVRHGEAENSTPTISDSQRELTDKGRSDIHKIGKFIKNSSLSVKQVYYSPYTRTKHTAEILSEELKYNGEMVASDDLAAGRGCTDIISCLVNFSNSDTVLLVGHNPDITYFAAKLLGNSSVAENLVFQPGSTIAINVAREKFNHGQIIWAISPDNLGTES
ncbi:MULTISPECIES: phosphohistidine phosphatase SixA [Leptospira]|uniref:Phosphohistidine phosphatase SixA n=2 Tax=Leptospira TaxID=171 RepID=A0ABT3LT75_9LEPT|nr:MULTISPECIES: phosphohistidine phosphatase SixA [Leptospira]MBL0953891.1 phosphohistidine phosphatase SixA [Leptospira sp.]MCW7460904.1 phosphohistidine phosphatase SixA [Leptospira limi]MCW7502502.1 phosphohistidine phosphatase SixA [Leptospira paudalimensis]